ncbi:sugar transferase [Bifidobacterium boum]|uniref:sugar transferase n=1 Tax=Bifidobacterium boum TaxID=78343 RepID=UPI002E2520FD
MTVTAIVTVPIAIAIKLTDGGPIFYTQTRVGRRDKPFKMIKFRSMVVNADKMKAELAKETGQDGRFIIQNEGRFASHQGRQVYP